MASKALRSPRKRALRFGFPRASAERGPGSANLRILAVGFPWNSLDSLDRNEPFQRVVREPRANFIHHAAPSRAKGRVPSKTASIPLRFVCCSHEGIISGILLFRNQEAPWPSRGEETNLVCPH